MTEISEQFGFGRGKRGAVSRIAGAFALSGGNYFIRNSNLIGAVDSPRATFSIWSRINSTALQTVSFLGNNENFSSAVSWDASTNRANALFNGSVATFQKYFADTGTGSWTPDDLWHNFLFSFDTAVGSHMYFDDVNVEVLNSFNTGTFDAAGATIWTVGTNALSPGSNVLDGCIAFMYVHLGAFVDFSVVANRRFFIDANGNPVFLPGDASVVAGSKPHIWSPNGDLRINRGGGGAFLLVGSPANCANRP